MSVLTTLKTVQKGAGVVVTTAASVCLAFLMLIVVADVAMRAIDPKWRIAGTLDYVEFSLDWMIYLSIAAAFFASQVIAVDIIDAWDTKGWFYKLGQALTLIALITLGSQIIRPALGVLEWGEVTFDLGILKFYYWIAIWVGVGFSVIAVALEITTKTGARK
ncbi:MAG: TRAP transporter small permease subunit [Paracoccaceae bacterium]